MQTVAALAHSPAPAKDSLMTRTNNDPKINFVVFDTGTPANATTKVHAVETRSEIANGNRRHRIRPSSRQIFPGSD